ncbi:MAG: hypothetical protein JW880_00675 [Candidatus Thermoplasmatota archaeon]|nr:hypothetical protein [Candidatus Thermoplasmatota archaeon]
MFIAILTLIAAMAYFEYGMWQMGVGIIFAGCIGVLLVWYLAALEEREITREYSAGWEFNATAFAKPLLGFLVSLFMLLEGIALMGVSNSALEQTVYLFFLVLAIVSFGWMIISLRG